MANGKVWSKKEVCRLLTLSEQVSQREASKILGRSQQSVSSKIKALGIKWRRGCTSLLEIAREFECSIVTVSRVANVLFWSEPVVTGKGNGSRYKLDPDQADRLRRVLGRQLARHSAHRAAGRRRNAKQQTS